MRVGFVGFKQVSGFCSVDTAEFDLRRYLAKLEGNGVAYTIEEIGDDFTTGWLVETGCPELLQKGDEK